MPAEHTMSCMNAKRPSIQERAAAAGASKSVVLRYYKFKLVVLKYYKISGAAAASAAAPSASPAPTQVGDLLQIYWYKTTCFTGTKVQILTSHSSSRSWANEFARSLLRALPRPLSPHLPSAAGKRRKERERAIEIFFL